MGKRAQRSAAASLQGSLADRLPARSVSRREEPSDGSVSGWRRFHHYPRMSPELFSLKGILTTLTLGGTW